MDTGARARRRTIVTFVLATSLLGALAAPAAGKSARPPKGRPTTTTTVPATTTTQAPSTTTTAPESEPCGGSLPKAGGGEWECTLAEEFDGPQLDRSLWVPQETATSGFAPGGACFVDDPDNVAVSDGALHLTVREEAQPFVCPNPVRGAFTTSYTSASVSTFARWSQAFGRFEIRAKISDAQVKGLQTALWLWPDNPLKYGPWPISGEIDIAELFSQYPDRAIPFVHYWMRTWDLSVTNNWCLIEDLDDWHTYAVEWTDETITILYDGEVCLSHRIDPFGLSAPAPFDQPFIVALTQALGQGTNAIVPGVTPLPATTSVDYVRVWE